MATDAAVLAIGLDTTQVKAGKLELDALAITAKQAEAATDGLVAGWKRTADTLGKSRSEVIAYDAAQLKLSASQTASVQATIASIAAYDAQQVAQKRAAQAAAEQAVAQQAVAASEARAAQAAASTVAAWVAEAAALGKTKTQLIEMEAAQLNLTASQRAAVASSVAQMEAFEAEAVAMEKSKTRANELAGALAGFIGIVGVAELAKQFVELSDSMATLEARMKSATDSEDQAKKAIGDLRDLASETQMKFEPLAKGFIEVGEAVKNLGGTSQTTTQIMQALTFAARAQGQSAEDAAGMAETFARALNLGVQGGREFVGLLKQNDDVARALAAGLGVTTQELKRLAQEGLVDPQKLVAALISQMKNLQEEAQKMPKTVGGSLTEVYNEIQRAASGGNANALADFLHAVAVGIKLVQDDSKGFASELVDVTLKAVTFGLSENASAWEKWASRASNATKNVREVSGKIGGLEPQGPPDLFTGDKAFQAALGQFNQQVQGSNTAAGINQRADNQVKIINGIWDNMIKADAEKATAFKTQQAALIGAINRDRNLQLQALAKLGTAGIQAIYGQWDKQAALETSAFTNLARVEQAGLAQQQAILENAHNLGIVSETNYIKRRGDLLAQGAQSEIARIRATYGTTLAELQKVQDSLPRNAEEVVAKQTKVAELTKTLTDLAVAWGLAEQKVGDITTNTANDILVARDKERQSIQQILDSTEDYVQGLKDQNDDLKLQIDVLGKTDVEAKKLQATHAADLDLRKQLLPIERELRELEITGQGDSARADQLRASVTEITQQNRDQLGIQKQRIDQYDEESKRIDGIKTAWGAVSDFVSGFVNALQGGWKNAMKFMADQFKQLLLKLITELALQKFVIPLFLNVVGAGGAGAVQGATPALNAVSSIFGGQGGAGNLLSSVGGAGGLFNSFAGSTAGIGLGLGETVGTSAAASAAGGLSLGVEAGAGAATGALSAAGMTVAAAIPVIGWAVAAAAAIYAIVQANKKPSPATGQFKIGGKDDPLNQFEDSIALSSKFGQIGFADQGTQQFSGEAAKVFDKMVNDALDAFASRLSGGDVDKLAAILQNTTFKAFSGTFTTEDFLGKFGGDILQQVVQAAFGVLDPALGDVVAKFHGTAAEVGKFADSLLAIHDASKNFSDDFKANIVGALDDATQETADKVTAFVSIYQALGSAINGLGPKLEKLDPTSILAFVDALGGAQAALASQAYIANNFTTQQDKLNDATKQLNAAFADLQKQFPDLNVTVPETHQAFLDLLGSFDLTTDSGRQAYAAVSALAAAFVSVHGTADAAAHAVSVLDSRLDGFYTGAEADSRKFMADWDAVHKAWTTLGAQLLAIGVDHIPTTLQGFRDLVNSIDATTPAGAALRESLLQLAPAVLDLNQTVQGLLDTFHQNFDSPQQAIQAGWDKIHDVWNKFGDQLGAIGDHIPTTTAAFHDFVEAVIAMYGPTSDVAIALLHLGNDVIVPLNSDIANLAKASDQADAALGRLIGDLQDAASQASSKFQSIMSEINELSSDKSVGTFGDQLSLKLNLLSEQTKKYAALLAAEQSGPNPYGALAQEYQKILALLGDASSQAAKDLAQYTILTAQYGDAMAQQLVALEDWYATQQALLAGNSDALAALKKVFDARWQDIIKGTAAGVDGTADQLNKLKLSIQDYLKSLKQSDLSPESPLQKFYDAQKNYNDLLKKAQGGDQDALSKITGASDAYLQLARMLFASSPQYNAIFDAIFKQLTDLSTINKDPGGNRFLGPPVRPPGEAPGPGPSPAPGSPTGPPSATNLHDTTVAIVDALTEIKHAIVEGKGNDKVVTAVTRAKATLTVDRKR